MYLKIFGMCSMKKLVFSLHFQNSQNLYAFCKDYFKLSKPFLLFYIDDQQDKILLLSDDDLHNMLSKYYHLKYHSLFIQ